MILKYVPNINQTVYEHKCMPTELTNELMTYVRDGEEEKRGEQQGACNSLLSLGCPNRS